MMFRNPLSPDGKPFTKENRAPWLKVYPFFLAHILGFGAAFFYAAYFAEGTELSGLYIGGLFVSGIYFLFYFTMFGREEVEWMLVNALLGLLGTYTQIGWILALFGKSAGDYSANVHVIPFIFFVLFAFLLRRAVLDLFYAKAGMKKEQIANTAYVIISLLIHGVPYLLRQ